MANLFKSVPYKKPKRNFFNLSHEVFTTCEIGQLVPIFCEPVVPGDSFQVSAEALVRFAPQIAPFMSRVNVYTHFFFVPYRLIWDDFETFKTGGSTGTRTVPWPVFKGSDSLNPGPFELNGWRRMLQKGSLADYLDFGVKNMSDLTSSIIDDNVKNIELDALPFRAYLKVWNDYYRDETFSEDLWDFDSHPTYEKILMGSGDISLPWNAGDGFVKYLFSPRYRAWEKDYFTSALPWAQRGGEVSIPAEINVSAPVTGSMSSSYWSLGGGASGDYRNINFSSAGSPVHSGPAYFGNTNPSSSSGDPFALGHSSTEGRVDSPVTNISSSNEGTSWFDKVSGLTAKQSIDGIGITINELRYTVAAQNFLEQMARGGSRYIEQNLSMFGVRSSDARLQRPEFLGGGVSPVVVSEVVQQSQTTESSPQGNISGHAVSAQRTRQFRRFFEEDGLVIGIMSIQPKASYIGGTPRKWLKRDRFDMYFPAFANLGEQPIYNQELFVDYSHPLSPLALDSENNQTWGYTPRYAEYKFIPSRIHGDFTQDNFDFWHFGRKFDKLPTLGETFIFEPPTQRVFAVQESSWNHCWVQLYLNIKAKRPMPKFGVPRLV